MSETVQIRRNLTAEGVDFVPVTPGESSTTLRFPLGFDQVGRVSPTVLALETLWFEERVVEMESGYRLPFSELYRLNPAEAAALGLPSEPTAVQVQLATRGYAGGKDFAIRAMTRGPGGGDLPVETRHGAVFRLGDELLLVPQAVAELYRHLDAGPPPVLADQLLYVGEARRLAETCGATLDSYLANQEIITPAGIGVEVESLGPAELELRPVLEGIPAEQFGTFGRSPGPTRSVEMEIDGSKRRRLVLGPEQRAAADDVKQRTRLKGADVPRFLDNPEAFLPDSVDLSRFSLRVRGLVPRRYNSQPYVRLQPTEKRDWFALGVDIELADLSFGSSPASDRSSEPTPSQWTGADAGASAPVLDGATAEPPVPSITPADYAGLCEQVRRTGERYVLHGDSWIEIEPEAADRYLQAWNAAEDDGTGTKGIPAERIPLVLDVISNVDELEFDTKAPADMVLPDLPEYPLPASLHAELMPHQMVGYRWMRYLHEQGYGGLLADDMGLGKTVQVISLLAHLADAGQLQPALVVLPVSLLENWQRELARFCPRIRRIYVHQGATRLRHPEAIAQWEVVLTTYETLRRDQLLLGQVDWSVIACDEAQKVKNPTSQATSAVKGMKAKLRLAMTGTPVENGLSELWCIVDWAQPGKLGSQREFRDQFERPMQDADEGGRADLAFRLQHQLTPHYIRRIKQDVLEGLPPRGDREYMVSMGPRQQRLYAEIIRHVRSRKMIPIEGLQHLIAVASHPELFEASGQSMQALIDECPKLQQTLEILDGVRAYGEKAVIFTRYRQMQQILQQALADRFGVHAAILNGEVQGPRRQGLVDRFNQAPGFGAMILSPEAAGVGLNIVGANHAIHYTRLWNPAKENQATDRVHRIGQTRPVTVHYPIVGGGEMPSVEERLAVLLGEKQALARDVVRPRESLSVERELFEIFDLAEAA